MAANAWLRIDVDPNFEMLAEMTEHDCFYNGARMVRAKDALCADRLVSFLRSKGHEVQRAQPPEQKKFAGWTRFAVSNSIDFPARIFS